MAQHNMSLASAEIGRTFAHRWMNRLFILVPGPERYNFCVRPEVDAGQMFECDHGVFNATRALRHLVSCYGGIERILTEEMRKEALACTKAKTDPGEAAKFLLSRYLVRVLRLGELSFKEPGRSVIHSAVPDQLDRLTELPDVSALAKIHGSGLGQSLLSRIALRRSVVR